MGWKLPAPRNFGWKMKPLDSAQTCFEIHDGVFHLEIEHDLIKGVTPAMLAWWFSHIGGDMVYQGRTYPKYLVWHPIDHIHWALAKPSPRGDAAQGAHFRIVEAFGGNLAHLVDSVDTLRSWTKAAYGWCAEWPGWRYFHCSTTFTRPMVARVTSPTCAWAHPTRSGALFSTRSFSVLHSQKVWPQPGSSTTLKK